MRDLSVTEASGKARLILGPTSVSGVIESVVELPLTAWERAVRAYEVRLVVGARVRVKINQECPFVGPEDLPGLGHRSQEDGLVGTITRVIPDLPYPDGPICWGHRFYCEYDCSVKVGDAPFEAYTGGAWTAGELVLLDTAGAAREGADGAGYCA